MLGILVFLTTLLLLRGNGRKLSGNDILLALLMLGAQPRNMMVKNTSASLMNECSRTDGPQFGAWVMAT